MPASFISLAEGAVRFGVSERTLRRAISAGRLTGYRFGPRLIRVDTRELDALLKPIPTGGNAA